MASSTQDELRRLRSEAEKQLMLGNVRGGARRPLKKIEGLAETGTEDWAFALRYLAELEVEKHPWRAALRLQSLRRSGWGDDSVEALFGLTQAILGNFGAAANAYRRAVQRAPRNAWYRHNLGHILDVALDQPKLALEHLRMAASLAPDETDIIESLRECELGIRRLNRSAKGKTPGPARKRPGRHSAVARRSRIKTPAALDALGLSGTQARRVRRMLGAYYGNGPAEAADSMTAAALYLVLADTQAPLTQSRAAQLFGVSASATSQAVRRLRAAVDRAERANTSGLGPRSASPR